MPNTRWLTCCGCLILVLGLILPASGTAATPGKLKVQTQTVSPQGNATTEKPQVTPITLPRGHKPLTPFHTKAACFADCGDGTGFICSGPGVSCVDGVGCSASAPGVTGFGDCSDGSITFIFSN